MDRFAADRREFRQRSFDDLARNVADDEDQPRASIRRRPALHFNRRVKDVLYPVHHDRPIGYFGDVHQPLETQEIVALKGCHVLQPLRKCRPADRLINDEAEGGYLRVMRMRNCCVIAVRAVTVMMMRAAFSGT